MRFLVDNSLSPRIATRLREAGNDAMHIRDYDLQAATDDVVLRRAVTEARVLLAADTDFGTILAFAGANVPSVIQFRTGTEYRPDEQAAILLANLPSLLEPLSRGCLVTFTPGRVRVRSLPL